MRKRKNLNVRSDWKKIPNLITEFRLIIGVIPPPIIHYWPDLTWVWLTSLILFVFAAATDGLDGYVARKRKEETELGKFLDPLVDKIVIIFALISLSMHFGIKILWLLTVIVSLREISVTALRIYVERVRNIVIAAAKIGKEKMISQVVFVSLLIVYVPATRLIGLNWLNDLLLALIYMSGVIVLWLTIKSGIEYFSNHFSGKYVKEEYGRQ